MTFFPEKKYSRQIYLSGIFLLVTGLPLSMFAMSVSQFVLLGAWIIEGNISKKIKRAFTQPVFLVLAGVYFLHVLGLIHTADFKYAVNDLRIKIPLLLLPLIFFTSPPLSQKEYHSVLAVFIAAVFISALISVMVYAGIIHRPLHDIRDISIFISHIRLSLLVCIAIICCIYFLKEKQTGNVRISMLILIVAFTAFLVLLESFTGLFILSCIGIYILFSFLNKQSPIIARTGLIAVIIIIVISAYKFYIYIFVDSLKPAIIHIHELPQVTALGHPYTHDISRNDVENGNPVWIKICEAELDSAWNARSHLSYSGKDERGQFLKYTLIRYLASKNLPRDAEGISHLDENEIRAIEMGIANVDYAHLSDIKARVHQLAWEYRQYRLNNDPTGHSVMQRFEFWKTALFIISKHPLTGVGTGDVQKEFDKAYIESNSRLELSNRLRAHNQFLTMTVAFGLIGGCYFIFSLIYPAIHLRNPGFLFSTFLIVALLSMIAEDTLETQAGVTFFSFFNSFFISQSKKFMNSYY